MCDAHHYVLDDPQGGQVRGECRECGVVRTWKSNPYDNRDFNAVMTRRDPLIHRIYGQFGLPRYFGED